MGTTRHAHLKRLALTLCLLGILLAWAMSPSAWAAPHQNALRQTVPPTPPTPTITPTPTPPPEVPEPSTLLLLASGLGALGGYLGLRRAAKK